MDSVWTISAQLPSFETLKENIKTDVLIIGGGLAGLLCAWRLKQAGVDAALVEADTICGGITKNTTAKITAQHPQLFLNALETTASLLTPTTPRCPHMGCVLKYNKAEHSWDCPCHGSRFAEDGTLIDNPATDDKRL